MSIIISLGVSFFTCSHLGTLSLFFFRGGKVLQNYTVCIKISPVRLYCIPHLLLLFLLFHTTMLICKYFVCLHGL